jgi:hypothetical protein
VQVAVAVVLAVKESPFLTTVQREVGHILIQKLPEMFGVRPLFVWQPVPTYRYDFHRRSFPGPSNRNRMFRFCFRRVGQIRASKWANSE